MIVKMFCIFDSKAAAYNQPIFMPSTGQAVRAFTTAVNDPTTDFHRYPGDFTLFEVGEWDDNTCAFHTPPVLTKLATGHEVKAQQQAKQPSIELLDHNLEVAQ